ncbi:hypothetical protein B0H17DRAFT_1142430 [Mycena rosella]|uniref:Uncharacterized protein n=1 Tax=Mycena rosella TaxID=1033263 RepID=A0AAD7CXN4_MYCRO|nr:hypothetical protein B0H17DRAFT_1142430 [Mycena rosella]
MSTSMRVCSGKLIQILLHQTSSRCLHWNLEDILTMKDRGPETCSRHFDGWTRMTSMPRRSRALRPASEAMSDDEEVEVQGNNVAVTEVLLDSGSVRYLLSCQSASRLGLWRFRCEYLVAKKYGLRRRHRFEKEVQGKAAGMSAIVGNVANVACSQQERLVLSTGEFVNRVVIKW